MLSTMDKPMLCQAAAEVSAIDASALLLPGTGLQDAVISADEDECSDNVLCVYLALQALVVRHQGGKLASLVEAGSQQSWYLLDHGLTGQEGTVLLGCNRARQTVRTCCYYSNPIMPCHQNKVMPIKDSFFSFDAHMTPDMHYCTDCP